MKIAIISCYDQIDYIRALVLRAGFAAIPGVETIIVKNKHRGLLRYLEVPYKILATKFRQRPDAYVITFRGYEMLPFVLLIKGRKPLIFDELVSAVAYLHEHHVLRPGSFADKLFVSFYGWLIRRCRFVLADTDEHAASAASLSKADPKLYATVPIGTDETLFYQRVDQQKKQGFTVYYYGVMVKLHGLQYFLDAAVELCKKYPDITFITGGDRGKAGEAYNQAIQQGARIEYREWFPYEELADYMRASSLTVGGPFGDTPQSQFVITTKTFQALACGAPVLVGRNKVNSALHDRDNSLVVPQGDTKAIVDAISWAYEHPKELARIGKAGRKLYDQEFSNTVIQHKLQRLVKEL